MCLHMLQELFIYADYSYYEEWQNEEHGVPVEVLTINFIRAVYNAETEITKNGREKIYILFLS